MLTKNILPISTYKKLQIEIHLQFNYMQQIFEIK